MLPAGAACKLGGEWDRLCADPAAQQQALPPTDTGWRCDAWQVGKRPSFIELATRRLSFLVDDWGFAGPETGNPAQSFPELTRVCYHRGDMIIEVVHVAGYMGEEYVQTRCRRKDGRHGDWVELGRNPIHTGYQLRRALDLQAGAICCCLGQTSAGTRRSCGSGTGGGPHGQDSNPRR